MRYDLKKYLEIQIEEKRKEKEFEKSLWKEQGKIWNIDSEKYALQKKEIEEKIKKMNLKNAGGKSQNQGYGYVNNMNRSGVKNMAKNKRIRRINN